MPAPFVMYANLETLLQKLEIQQDKRTTKSYTVKTNRHQTCSYRYKVVCILDDKLSKPFQMFRGKQSITKFFQALFEE